MAALSTYYYAVPFRIVCYHRYHWPKMVDACNHVGLGNCRGRAILCTSPAVESRPKRITILDDGSVGNAP